MTSVEYLKNNKQSLLNEWFEWIISVYPESSRKYFNDVSQQFTNPVGYSLFNNISLIFDCLVNQNFDSIGFRNALEEVLKIRLVQQPASLKEVNIFEFIWEKLVSNLQPNLDKKEISLTIELINSCNYILFEIYSDIHKRIIEIQRDEIKHRYGKIVERLNERYSKGNNYVNKTDT